ncbi:MAG: hypothetical protein RLZZ519_815 [Bacteroidota bacterium]|jgi:hypothetical protein
MPQIQSSPGRFVPFAGKRPLSKGQIYNKCQKATDKLARHNQRFIQTPSRFHPDCYIRPSPVRQSCPSNAIHPRSKSPLPMPVKSPRRPAARAILQAPCPASGSLRLKNSMNDTRKYDKQHPYATSHQHPPPRRILLGTFNRHRRPIPLSNSLQSL